MEREVFIKKNQILEESHFPIFVYFNILNERMFLGAIRELVNGKGFGVEFAVCLFSDDMDFDEDKFDGVEFSLETGEEVIVDFATFYYYLKIACNNYIKISPDDSSEVKELLEKSKTKFNIG